VRKPDPVIYQELINRVGLPASHIAFVDDLAENLPAAEQLGIRVVRFIGLDSLRETLRELQALPSD
jgi:putative hydrolase of the HAD superfamily